MTLCPSTEPIEVEDWRALEVHDLCAAFPRLPDEEFELLRQSIMGMGVRLPIVLFEGKILDGRQRYEICLAEDIEPRFERFMGPGSALAFLSDMNICRRHLTSEDRQTVEDKLSDIHRARARARWEAEEREDNLRGRAR